jgi:hypothetical protein
MMIALFKFKFPGTATLRLALPPRTPSPDCESESDARRSAGRLFWMITDPLGGPRCRSGPPSRAWVRLRLARVTAQLGLSYYKLPRA